MVSFERDMEREREREGWMMRRSYMLERQKMMTNTMIMMIVMITLAIILFFLVVPLKGILGRYEQRLSAEVEGMKRIPSIQKELDSLEKRLLSITTGSIDSRLGRIEEAIRIGSIKPEEVATIQDINKELGILKTYMFRDPSELVELKQLQKNYQEIRENQDMYITEDDAMRELNFIRNLFYASISLFGLLLAGIGGTWFQSSRRLKQIDEKLSEPVTADVARNTEQANPADHKKRGG